MKNLLIRFIFLMLYFPGMSQDWIYINGTVTDSANGYPIANHAVTVMTDSVNGSFYYNVVNTDSSGYYWDDIPVLSDSTGMIFVQTLDCNNNLHQAVIIINPVNNTYTRDFQICNLIAPPCDASFAYYADSSNTPPYNYHFTDQSTGNIAYWYWDFGDGQSSAMQSPEHSYVQAGTYTVCLNITGTDSSCFDYFCQTIEVGLNSECIAYFTYYPQPQGSPDSIQFTDLSAGNITGWSWSFGDGTSSVEQNPLHTFPGPGNYYTCLTITGYNCTDTYSITIIISDTVYHQVYGQVFAGNFPLQTGNVILYVINPNGVCTPFGDGFPVDSNGVYYFTLVPDGTYLIQAVPVDSSGYLPSYDGDVINWQQATQVVLGVPNNPHNINLVAAGQMTPGPGSCSGQINNGLLQRSAVDKINMILMNESGAAIGFDQVESSGAFAFLSMDYGTYYLRAELPGVSSDNMKIEITPERPYVDVFLNFSGSSILGLLETKPALSGLSIYPNPASGLLHISIVSHESDNVVIEIFTITGQLAYRGGERVNTGENTISISLDDLPAGIYSIRISFEDGMSVVRKVVKR